MKLAVINELPVAVHKRERWCEKRFFVPFLKRAEQKIPKHVLNRFGGGTLTLSVVLVDGKVMRRLNKRFRGKDCMTDVLSFEADASQHPYRGEVVVCLSVAARQAREYHRSVQQETALLFVHGVLHLCGYDHIKVSERKKMFALQDAILGERMCY